MHLSCCITNFYYINEISLTANHIILRGVFHKEPKGHIYSIELKYHSDSGEKQRKGTAPLTPRSKKLIKIKGIKNKEENSINCTINVIGIHIFLVLCFILMIEMTLINANQAHDQGRGIVYVFRPSADTAPLIPPPPPKEKVNTNQSDKQKRRKCNKLQHKCHGIQFFLCLILMIEMTLIDANQAHDQGWW